MQNIINNHVGYWAKNRQPYYKVPVDYKSFITNIQCKEFKFKDSTVYYLSSPILRDQQVQVLRVYYMDVFEIIMNISLDGTVIVFFTDLYCTLTSFKCTYDHE